MPAFFKRPAVPPAAELDERPSDAVAALIANLETNVGALRANVSHREFRTYVRESNRSQNEAWESIRAAARQSGR